MMTAPKDALNAALEKRVLAKIDLDALAQELEPEIRKIIKSNLIEFVKENFYDAAGNGDLYQILEEVAEKTLRQAFQLEQPTKKARR